MDTFLPLLEPLGEHIMFPCLCPSRSGLIPCWGSIFRAIRNLKDTPPEMLLGSLPVVSRRRVRKATGTIQPKEIARLAGYDRKFKNEKGSKWLGIAASDLSLGVVEPQLPDII